MFEFFKTNQQILHKAFKWLRQTFENKIMHVLQVSVDLVLAFIAGILKNSPTVVQIPLKMLGLHDFLERKLAAYNDASEAVRIKLEEKEIERNRPKSPKKTMTKIVHTEKSKERPVAPKKTATARRPLKLNLEATEDDDSMYSDGESAKAVQKKRPINAGKLTARTSPIK